MSTQNFPIYSWNFSRPGDSAPGIVRCTPGRLACFTPPPAPVLSVASNLWFYDPTQKAQYFTANPDQLVDGLVCVIGDGRGLSTLQSYTAATGWVDVTSGYSPGLPG
jgi:hypothetical protein